MLFSHPSWPLTDIDLHFWHATLEAGPQEFSHFRSLLWEDEIARANRFYFKKDRTRYIIGRGILRTLLGSYLRLEASEIQFSYGTHGKPFVELDTSGPTLQFNLAHSYDQAVFIFGWDHLVGIDLEHIRPLKDAHQFAEQFYSNSETALLNSLSGDEKWDAFYKFWTCKEAFLKANGSGLTAPLNQVEIHLENDDTARLRSVAGDTRQASNWILRIFKPAAGYQAAVALRRDGVLRFQQPTIYNFEFPSQVIVS